MISSFRISAFLDADYRFPRYGLMLSAARNNQHTEYSHTSLIAEEKHILAIRKADLAYFASFIPIMADEQGHYELFNMRRQRRLSGSGGASF